MHVLLSQAKVGELDMPLIVQQHVLRLQGRVVKVQKRQCGVSGLLLLVLLFKKAVWCGVSAKNNTHTVGRETCHTQWQWQFFFFLFWAIVFFLCIGHFNIKLADHFNMLYK